eukprot:9347042-Pyramimonas_sp.AAC.1
MRQADASDVSESIPLSTSPVDALQPELSAETRQHLRTTRTIRIVSRPSSGSRPSSELGIRQADAPDVSKSIP